MRIFTRTTVLKYGVKYPEAELLLRAWLKEITTSSWRNPTDIKARFPHASIIGGKRVVFNIGGNKYRLIVEVDYEHESVFVHFFGTHNEYDKVNAETITWNRKS